MTVQSSGLANMLGIHKTVTATKLSVWDGATLHAWDGYIDLFRATSPVTRPGLWQEYSCSEQLAGQPSWKGTLDRSAQSFLERMYKS